MLPDIKCVFPSAVSLEINPMDMFEYPFDDFPSNGWTM